MPSKESGSAVSAVSGSGNNAAEMLGKLRAHRSRLALIVVIVIVGIIGASGSDAFLTWNNFTNVLMQVSIVGILACGTTMLMVSGGMDLSIGSGVSVTAMVGAYLMTNGWALGMAVLAALAAACLIGLIVGLLAAYSPTHPFIVTLGMMTLLQGVALLISDVPIAGVPDSFLDFYDTKILGLPVVVVVFLCCAILVHLILSRTTFGRRLYAIGGSESAAHLAGVRVRLVKIALYTLNGLIVGVAGALMLAQLSSAAPTMGVGLELGAIAAVAVGGTPIDGGRGGIIGTMLGVLLLGLIANALNLLSISSNLQYIIEGAVIIVAVMSQRSKGG